MRWEDERYVRFYTRDTPEWLALSWRARGLFGLILRAADRVGVICVGKLGKRGLSVAVHGPWAEIEDALEELLADGCLRWDEEHAAFLVPNYLEAQECARSTAARKRDSRERARAQYGGSSSASESARSSQSQNVTDVENGSDEEVTNRDSRDASIRDDDASGDLRNGQESRNVTTYGHETGRKVTNGHVASQSVTPCLAVPNHAKPVRAHEDQKPWPTNVLAELRRKLGRTLTEASDVAWQEFVVASLKFPVEARLAGTREYIRRNHAPGEHPPSYVLSMIRGEAKKLEHGTASDEPPNDGSYRSPEETKRMMAEQMGEPGPRLSKEEVEKRLAPAFAALAAKRIL